MKHVSVVEAKSHFSSLVAEVMSGEEIAVTRHGKVVARLVPDSPRMAAEAFHDLWNAGDKDDDFRAPPDTPAGPVASLDD